MRFIKLISINFIIFFILVLIIEIIFGYWFKENNFAQSHGYFLIALDELLKMDKGDFYNPIHTSPQGSKKIANTIYPFLKDFLN